MERRCFAIMPSRPCTFAASKKACPSPTTWSAKRTLRSSLEDGAKELLAALEWHAKERASVEEQQVERLVDEALRGAAGCLLEEAEVGQAVLPIATDLAFDDRLAGVDPGRLRQELREVCLGVVAVSGEHLRGAVVDDRLDAVAVPLDLEEPVVVAEGPVAEGRGHRLDEGRQLCVLRRAEVDLGDRRGAWLIQIASRSALTSSFVRPVLTLCGCSSASQPSTDASSRLWMSSHCSPPSSLFARSRPRAPRPSSGRS
jgi:hypothetical protein